MKKVISAIGIILCAIAISVNIAIQSENGHLKLDMSKLGLQAMAQGEIEPLDEWTEHVYECPAGSTHTQGRSCLPVANGSPSCFVVLCN